MRANEQTDIQSFDQNILNDLRQRRNNSWNSILDQIFDDHLLRYSQSRIEESSSYTEQQFSQFRDRLLEVTGELKIENYELKRALQTRSLQAHSYSDRILNARSLVHPIYVPELVSLLQRNQAARQFVQGRDLIVILGTSGAGKSTLAQIMLGYTLVEQRSETEMTTLVPEGGLKPQHQQFVAKASSKSVTKYVSAVELKLPLKYQSLGEVYLADTPGFFDSEGPIVDASNSLSALKVLTSANSIRFVVLINSRNWGTRGQGFKKLARIISKLLQKYPKQKFVYCLNCFNEQQLRELPLKIKDIKHNLNNEERGDIKFSAVVNHFCTLMEKVQKISADQNKTTSDAVRQIPQLVVMNPTSINLKQIYQKFLNEEHCIQNPSSIIDSTLSFEVISTLKSEVNILAALVHTLLQQNKTDAAIYYINNINTLAQLTSQDYDVAQAKKKLDLLKSKLQEQFRMQFEKVSKIMLQQMPSLCASSSRFVEAKQIVTKLVGLQQAYRRMPFFADFTKNAEIQQLVNGAAAAILTEADKQFSQDLILTVQNFSANFDQDFNTKFIIKVNQKINALYLEIESNIKMQEFDKLESQIIKLKFLQKIIDNKVNSNQSTTWKSKLTNKIEQRRKKCMRILEANNQVGQLRDTDIKQIKVAISTFASVDQYSGVQQIKQIISARKLIESGCLDLCRRLMAEFSKSAKQGSEDIIRYEHVQNMLKCKRNIEKIMAEIKEVRQLIRDEYLFAIEGIVELISTKMAVIDSYMSKIKVEDWSAVKNTHASIKTLKMLTLMCEDEQRNKCRQAIGLSQEVLTSKLKQFFNQLKHNIFSIETSQANLDRLVNAYKSMEDVSQVTNTEGEDSIDRANRQIKVQLSQKLDAILAQLNKFVDQKMTSTNNEKYLQFQRYISTAAKIKKFFDQTRFIKFKSEELNKGLNQVQCRFGNCLFQIFTNLKYQIVENISKLSSKINEGVRAEKEAHLINRLRKILNKICENKELRKIIEDFYGLNIDDEQLAICDSLQEIHLLLSKQFEEQADNSYSIKSCFALISTCDSLKSLDLLPNAYGCKFEKLLSHFKSELSEKLKLYGLDAELKQIIQTDSINIATFKRMYEFLRQFPESSNQQIKLRNMLDSIKGVLKEEDKGLQTIFSKQFGSNVRMDETEIEKIYLKISNHLTRVADLNEVVQQQFKFAVSKDTVQKISTVGQRVIMACEKKVMKRIEEGKYIEAQHLIQRVGYLETLLLNLNIQEFREYAIKREAELGKSLSCYYYELMQAKKQLRATKFLGTQPIKLDSLFRVEFEAFTQNQKFIIREKVIQQFEREVEDIIEQSRKESEFTLKKNLKQVFSKTQHVERAIRQQIKQFIEQAKIENINQRQKQLKYSKECFHIRNSCDLLLKQDRVYILKYYEEAIQSFFESKKEQLMKYSQGSAGELINVLNSAFIEYFKSDSYKCSQKLKIIYEKHAIEFIEIIESYFISRLLISIRETLFAATSGMVKLLDVEVLKSCSLDLFALFKFLTMNKSRFPSFRLDEKLIEVENLFDEFYSYLMKKADTLQKEEINMGSERMNQWCFEASYFLWFLQFLTASNNEILCQRLKAHSSKIEDRKKQFQVESAIKGLITKLPLSF